ncbi:MAG: hypothetical protein Q8S73_20455 [Deltaproteobacteria bacterium]|nr:hypothetical protein [Myxococcales bacterium]MDP3216492.1 hypothetical protein [Deltaproteobacteria bacterium]
MNIIDVLGRLGCLEQLDLKPDDRIAEVAFSTAPAVASEAVSDGARDKRSLAAFIGAVVMAAVAWTVEAGATPTPTPTPTPTVERRADERLPAAVGVFQRSGAERRIVVLESSDGAVRPLAGTVVFLDPDVHSPHPGGRVVMDARPGPVALQVVVEGSEYVILLDAEGVLRVGRIERAPARVVDVPRVELPSFEGLTPDSVGWFAGREAAPWLRVTLEGHARSPWVLDRVGAAGTAARFDLPTFDEAGSVLPGANGAARAWARAIPKAQADLLEATACDAARGLHHQLAGQVELGVARDPGEPGALRSLCLARDDLESVAFVLESAGRGSTLRSLLRAFDEQAQEQLVDLVVDEALLEDPRLAQVAWSDPLAWWGAVGRE